jgi:hypothetical protein
MLLNMRVQRTRSLASLGRSLFSFCSPLTRRPDVLPSKELSHG